MRSRCGLRADRACSEGCEESFQLLTQALDACVCMSYISFDVSRCMHTHTYMHTHMRPQPVKRQRVCAGCSKSLVFLCL